MSGVLAVGALDGEVHGGVVGQRGLVEALQVVAPAPLRAVVLGGEILLPEHLPEAIRTSSNVTESKQITHSANLQETQIIVDDSMELPVSLDDLLARIERHYLEAALLKSNGVKKKAAELLGINFRSFRYRLQKFDLND